MLNTPPDPDALTAALAARRHGVVSLAQLLEAGMDQYAIRRRVQAGHLHRLYRGVYAVGHVGLSFEGRCVAAVLASGPHAAVSHLTAAELFRVSRWPAPLIAVVTATQHAPIGMDVHRGRRLDALDETEFNGIPVTTVARMLVDLSDTLTPHQLASMIHQAAYWHRFDVAATRRAMKRANGRHNLARLEREIELHLSGSAGTRSAKEDAYLARLPAERRDSALVNTKLEVDFRWPDTKTVDEVDGPGHRRPATRAEDARRDAALTATGHEVTRIAAR